MRLHGETPRGTRRLPLSTISEGRFGRMFRRLPPAPHYPDDQLRALAEQTREGDGQGGWGGPQAPTQAGDNPDIPAGFTYLGQFIDHDITFDPASSLQRQNDPDALHDFRTPRFDLDSLYGSGPDDEPFQYDRSSGGLKFLVEPNRNGIEDLPRNSQDVALIGDPRNDENIIVSQLQLVFLRLHNKVVDQVLADQAVPEDRKFQEAQQRVRWHYQWVIVHDFLPRLVGQDLVDRLYEVGDDGTPEIRLRYYRPKVNPYMPVEFSVGAFRYGHSQVRQLYDLNGNVRQKPIFLPGQVGELDDLRGFRRLPQGWTADWAFFFEIDGATPQPSRLIDGKLSPALFDLPGVTGERTLGFRNLKRGQALNLPSGQDVARHLRAPRVFTGAELGAPEPTPLWFYILKESELHRQEESLGGRRLGPVGARIVAEVLLGLLRGDPQSYFSVNPGWEPTLPKAGEEFTVADLIKFAIS